MKCALKALYLYMCMCVFGGVYRCVCVCAISLAVRTLGIFKYILLQHAQLAQIGKNQLKNCILTHKRQRPRSNHSNYPRSHPHSNSCISISFYFSYFHIFANLFYTFAEIAMHFKCGIHKMHLPQTF